MLKDIEMINYCPDAKRLEASPISFPKSIDKFDVPIGTEVFLESTAVIESANKTQKTNL